ncbi:MAG: hypothetical protein E7413_05880 [Ruminococcaceae bacterium]|nr:hypothetical protein [Oscillospiraceae bacterium]
MRNRREYCTCNDCSSVYIDDDEWGVWDVCKKCGKIVEDSYKAYNHYDGEDHIDDPYDAD